MVLFRDSQAVRVDGALEDRTNWRALTLCSRGPSMVGAAGAAAYPAVIDDGNDRMVPALDGTTNAVLRLYLGDQPNGVDSRPTAATAYVASRRATPPVVKTASVTRYAVGSHRVTASNRHRKYPSTRKEKGAHEQEWAFGPKS